MSSGWSARGPCGLVLALALLIGPATAAGRAESTYRGFVEPRVYLFPEDAPTDPTNLVVDALVRVEAFTTPLSWLQFAAGVDVRANSDQQVGEAWRLDIADRGRRRPRLSARRLTATVTRRGFTADIGKQFIRWGSTDVVTPTDRFAPRDFTNVIDHEFLAVRGVRAVYARGAHSVEGAWVPFFTPSRMPSLTGRWTTSPAGVQVSDATSRLPDRTQTGFRWRYTTAGLETSASFFDGLNHLPNISFDPGTVSVVRLYPRLRMYGMDAVLPMRWVTAKAEAGYFASQDPGTDEHITYVVQLERQTGEWTLVGGYAGEVVTRRRTALAFAPDRGSARSFVGRAAYTIDANRSVAIETAVRQNLNGAYLKAEFSRGAGQHWRITAAGAVVRGEPDDFLGQYRRNSNLILAARYSF